MNLWERRIAETFTNRQKHQEEFLRCCLIYQLSLHFQGTNISKRDKQDDEETVVVAQYSTYFDKEIHEPPICYTKNNKLRIPSDPDEGLSFYINILECLEKDYFPVWIHNKFLDSILRKLIKQIWVLNTVEIFLCKCILYNSGIVHSLALLNIVWCNLHLFIFIFLFYYFYFSELFKGIRNDNSFITSITFLWNT